MDLSRPCEITRSVDVFYDLPKEERPFVTALQSDHKGLVQMSTRRMMGRKLFVWGVGEGGKNWQRWLSDGVESYIEIQAGIAKTQQDHIPMPDGDTWNWLEAYGQLTCDVDHLEYSDAVNACRNALNEMITQDALDEEHQTRARAIAQAQGEIVSVGAGWGALENLRREKADALYREATLIANTYASDLYDNVTSLDTVKKQLDAIDLFLDSTIWIINPSGRLILSTDTPLDVNTEIVVDGFDPTVTVGSYYTTGYFFDSFEQEKLSVFAPISTNYKVQGYVVIHTAMSDIRASSESILSISYIVMVIIFLLSFIILLFFIYLSFLSFCKSDYNFQLYLKFRQNYFYTIQALLKHQALIFLFPI